MPLYALTTFVGAFLLFQVEPILGKYLLPWFGGSPGVWTTCLLFFQTLLLVGYLYAHWLSGLRPRTQAWVHGALLVASLACLPIVPAEHWKPQGAGDPTLRILILLTADIGLPYLVLSATGPLLQAWWTRLHPERPPFWLYALSNAGSLGALVSYPFLIEWWLPRHVQASEWGAGLGLFSLLCIACAITLARRSPPAAAAAAADEPAPAAEAGSGWLWVALPALASALLLAPTNKLCEDLAVMPFLWVYPLGLYLLSFIACFSGPRGYPRALFGALAILAAGTVGALLTIDDADVPVRLELIAYGAALFAGCMFCHGELYRLKPAPRRLTRYYLAIAAGGALGGFFVAIVAPLVFVSFAELPIAFWALTVAVAAMALKSRSLALAVAAAIGAVLWLPVVAVLRAGDLWSDHPRLGFLVRTFAHDCVALARDGRALFGGHNFAAPYCAAAAAIIAGALLVSFADLRRGVIRAWSPRAAIFPVVLSSMVAAGLCVHARHTREDAIVQSRNFFGILTVFDDDADIPADHNYLLMHGRTTHGLQFVDPKRAMTATTYYALSSGVGLGINSLPWQRPRRLGFVGLGAGTLASYGRAGDTVRFYEINPAVVRLARTRFTYLARCPAHVDIVMGDARLSMERELAEGHAQGYDLLALDAFTSDAIPVHLLTEEAFRVYLRELRPDGILAVHISNRYFDLKPVVRAIAAKLGLSCALIRDDGDQWWVYDSDWVLVARDAKVLQRPLIQAGVDLSPPERRVRPPVLWTDDYASLFKVLR